MLGSIWNFIKRHRRKFLVSGAIIGGAVLLGKYAQRKLLELQEKEAAECLAHAKRQHHFDSNQRTCNMTILSMLPGLREALLQALDSESLTSQLKSKPNNKLEIWEELKVLSFTRTVVAVYSCCILVLVLRVQLNILGGYMYLDNFNDRDGVMSDLVATPTVQQKYLASIEYILGQGLANLIGAVQNAAQNALKEVSLKENLGLTEIQNIVNNIRQEVESRQSSGNEDSVDVNGLCQYMLPEEAENQEAGSLSSDEIIIGKMMKETRDMIESSDFQTVLNYSLDTGFNRLIDKLAGYFKPQILVGEVDQNVPFSPTKVMMALAKVIPVMNGMIHTVCADSPNQFIQELMLKEHVKDFAANIYEAFSQPDVSP